MTGTLAAAGISLPDDLATAVEAALDRALLERWVDGIWEKDAALWSADPGAAAHIADRLGWLHAPEAFLDNAEELAAFAQGVRDEGFEQVVLCGMGGSSLAPEVLARTYGTGPRGLPLHVLDSTDPAAVERILTTCDPHTTLYVVSSKSGTTTETLSFLAFFWDAVHQRPGRGRWPSEHFVAVSDPGKSLEEIPHSDEFRGVFLNPPDVGGRYSALTYVGMVPGALLDLDLSALLSSAASMARECREGSADNPGLVLGVTLGTLARAGRDKVTFLADPAVEAFGAWAEQLIAESTGKSGVGIVPVDREPVGAADRYGADRVFVRLLQETGTQWRQASDRLAGELRALGHPVIDLEVAPEHGLGAEFFRWEFATAVAGAVLGIDPFDEPNVAESKENTRRVLGQYRAAGRLPERPILATQGPLTITGGEITDGAITDADAGHGSVQDVLRRHLGRIGPSSYLALQAFVAATPERDEALAGIRTLLRDRTGRATTAGYGPRYLHSTGQLHKGGAPIGWFLQLVAGHPRDLEIPGAGHSFGTLIDAQALGDLASLEAHGLPVLRIHLSDVPDAGLAALRSTLEEVL